MNWNNYDVKNIEDTEFKVLFKKNSGFWLLINETGYEIISMLKKNSDLDAISKNIALEYSLNYDDILLEVQTFVNDVINKVSQYEEDRLVHKDSVVDKTITIHVTNRCNLRCPYCYKDAGGDEIVDELSFQDIINVVKQSSALGFNYVIFSGGEPTIRKDLFDIIKYISNNIIGVEVGIITNGTTNISDTELDVIVSCVKNVQISIDSNIEEINSITRGKGSLDKTTQLIDRLVERNYKNFFLASTPTTSNMTSMPSVDKLSSLLRFSANKGAKGLYINMLKPDGRLDFEQYSNFNIDEYWGNVDKTYSELKLLYTIGFHDIFLFAGSDFNHFLEGYSHSINCGLGCSELSINHNGNVYPCSSLMHEEFLLGNIKEQSISDIYSESKKMYSNVNVDNIEQCKNCEDKYICGGGCRALSYASTGDIKGNNPHCSQCKERIALWQMLSLSLSQKNKAKAL